MIDDPELDKNLRCSPDNTISVFRSAGLVTLPPPSRGSALKHSSFLLTY